MFKRIHFPVISSTNTWAKLHCKTFDDQKITVVTANRQTQGRGRYERSWLSSTGNFFGTFCLFEEALNWTPCSLTFAMIAAKSLIELGAPIQVKWPNDLFISKKKVGGILCERIQTQKGTCFIAGIGINLLLENEHLKIIDQPATSLDREGVHCTINSLLSALYKQIMVIKKEGWSQESYQKLILGQDLQ